MPPGDQALKAYLAAVEQAYRAGNATEHTYRPAFKALIEALAGHGITAINEPRQIDCGAPDFIVVRGTVPLGYIEAKDVGVDLGKTERSEQLARYRESLGNLVLTDYLEFRWYLDGELRLQASLPPPDKHGRIRWNDNAASEVSQLLGQFLAADIPLKSTPHDLATRMARLAQLIRGLITQAFKTEQGEGELHAQFEAFRKVLIESLTVEQFADMYAQTLAYGLFAARCNAPAAGFTRQSAASQLPRTNPFLRKLFNSIAGPDLDPRVSWAVDQLAELLARADMGAILEDFGRRTRREDPVVHFYETFLAAYDPKMREARGVYYTPEPVVNYIVRSVDGLLQREFGLKEGLAHAGKVRWKTLKTETTHRKRDFKPSTSINEVEAWVHRVQILDPATGTATFLYAVIQKIRERFEGNAGAWPGYVAEHLLPRLFGFELLMAPYAVAHMKLGLELERSGYDFASDERLGVFLTNSLEEAHEKTGLPLFTQWLADESQAASKVKRDVPVMVVLGNPPYSGHSVNKGEWITQLLRGEDTQNHCKTENYFECDGAPLGERNPKWLNDDYVKFIRFAQWRIEQTGHGVLAFVTNHGYLDNPTFRGMRESLLRGFDAIWLYDLHGNSKKKETAPGGGKDENVFDIQQGVAIGIFVKHAPSPQPSPPTPSGERETSAQRLAGEGEKLARVFHADLYGTRALKYATLDAESLEQTAWTELAPASPNYYFVPEDGSLREEYEHGWKITEAMPVNVLGFQTHRDDFAIDADRAALCARMARMRDSSTSDADFADAYGLSDNRDWNLAQARARLRNDPEWADKVIRVAYRPFDGRWGYFSEVAMDYPRRELIENVVSKDNLCLGIGRAGIAVNEPVWSLQTISHSPMDANIYRRGGVNIFPLWLYPRESTDLLDNSPREKTPNLAPDFIAALTAAVAATPSPEDTLAYIYAILYAPSYRRRYADFLKRDFPRVPLTSNRALFDTLVAIGRELIALHTMQATLPRITGFPVAGSNEVVKVRYTHPSPSGRGVGGEGTNTREATMQRGSEPSPAPAGHPLPEGEGSSAGRVWINDAQYFDGVPEAVWETHIGGYRVAEKWLKDRKGRLLSFDDIEHYQRVVAALARTLELQADIDAAIAAAGGWPLR